MNIFIKRFIDDFYPLGYYYIIFRSSNNEFRYYDRSYQYYKMAKDIYRNIMRVNYQEEFIMRNWPAPTLSAFYSSPLSKYVARAKLVANQTERA